MDSKRMNEEMLKVVKSEEAAKEFERVLKNLDSKAFTPEGVIQTYEIDYDSVKHNPMGGINVTLIINNDSNLIIENTFAKSKGIVEIGGISYSGELAHLLEDK